MRLFFDMFHPDIPTYVLLVVLSVVFVTSVFQYRLSRNRYNAMLTTWIAGCLVLMLWKTVIERVIEGHQAIQFAQKVHLIPLWSIQAIRDGYIETLYEKINNIIFFMPYGFLLGLRSTNDLRGSRGLRSLKGTILAGFITSVFIELLQLITRTGTCETDDVICNTLGCGVGVIMARCLCLGIVKYRKYQEYH